ncbi:hypothetical protein T484DRAFT_1900772, partial [Baffinella frigidus]
MDQSKEAVARGNAARLRALLEAFIGWAEIVDETRDAAEEATKEAQAAKMAEDVKRQIRAAEDSGGGDQSKQIRVLTAERDELATSLHVSNHSLDKARQRLAEATDGSMFVGAEAKIHARGEKLAGVLMRSSERGILMAAFRAFSAPVREAQAKKDFEGAFNLAQEEAARLRSGSARLAQEVEEATERQEEAEAAKG